MGKIFRAILLSVSFLFLCDIYDLHAQQIVVTPDPVYMGQIPLNSDAGREILIINSSAQTANISSITLSGSDTPYFKLVDNPGSVSLGPLQKMIITLVYTPQVTGNHQAQLHIQGNFTEKVVSISGAGTQISPMTTFERIIGSNDSESAASVKEDEDGFIVVGSFTPDDEEYNYLLVTKTDWYGKPVWEKLFGTSRNSDSGTDVLVNSDGSYIVLGNTESYGAGRFDMYLLKLDQNGNEVWSRTFGGAYDESARRIIHTSDEGYIICGNTKSTTNLDRDAFIVRVDQNGNTIWEKKYGGSGGETASAILQTDDGGFIFAGSTTTDFGYDFQIWIVKIDAEGNQAWAKTHGGSEWDEASSIAKTSDGGYILSGYTMSKGAGARDAYLLKVDSSGSFIWDKTFGDIHADGFSDVKETSDGGFIAAGRSVTFFSVDNQFTDMFIVRTDNQGELIWSKLIGSNQDERASSIQLTSDNGYIISGTTSSYSKSQNIHLLKLNQSGEITDIPYWQEINPPTAFNLKQNYPNPFNGQTTIEFTLNVPQNISLVIYDLAGNLIRVLRQGWHGSGEYRDIINADVLSSGIYFVQLNSGGSKQTLKMTLIK